MSHYLTILALFIVSILYLEGEQNKTLEWKDDHSLSRKYIKDKNKTYVVSVYPLFKE